MIVKCEKCGIFSSPDMKGVDVFAMADRIKELEKKFKILKEIAVNTELQWRKLNGHVVPLIQRELVEVEINEELERRMKQ